MAMGAVDIVPGVSGSTVAVLFGIYERFIAALRNIDLELLRATFSPIRHGLDAASRHRCAAVWREKDMPWLVNLVAGLGCAMVVASYCIPWLMEHYPAVTRGFFFGLVLGSTLTPVLALRRPRVPEIALAAVFAVLCFLLLGQHFEPPASLVSVTAPAGATLDTVVKSLPCLLPPEAVVAMPQNAPLREALPDLASLPQGEIAKYVIPEGTSVTLPVIQLSFSFISGFVAICAMLLPGISGSFILLVLGMYYGALNAAKGTMTALFHLQFASEHALVLVLLALGAVAGMATFSRALTWLFRRHRRLTMAAIVGILLGCLRAVWPFRETRGTETVNVLPSVSDLTFVPVMVACALALGIVVFSVWGQHKKEKDERMSA